MKRWIYTGLLLLGTGLCNLQARDVRFQTELLETLAGKVRFEPLDQCPAGYADAGLFNRHPLTVRYAPDGKVAHLGYRIFRESIKAESRTVMEFIERYFLELGCCTDTYQRLQKQNDDKFLFVFGDWTDCFSVTDSTDFKLSKIDNKLYEATWSNNGKTLLAVTFPISYELLAGMPLPEIQRTLYRAIKHAPKAVLRVDEDAFIQGADGIYCPESVSYYQLKELNNGRYYIRNEEGKYCGVYDEAHLQYAAANLFQIPGVGGDLLLRIEQSLYGFKSVQYTVRLSEWMNYCLEEHMNVYFAVEEETETSLKSVVVVENTDMGYNHLLSAVIPKDFVRNPEALIEVKLNPFIPTHNVSNLFQEYRSKPKKKL